MVSAVDDFAVAGVIDDQGIAALPFRGSHGHGFSTYQVVSSSSYLRCLIVSSSITVRAFEKSISELASNPARYLPGSSGPNFLQRR